MNATGLTTQMVQWCIAPNTLFNASGFVGPGNNITVVYFQTGTGVTKTYPNIVIKLKQGTAAGLTGVVAGAPEAGMTTVYSGTNVTVTSTAGGWISFTLQTPFLYDPTFPLFVELGQNSPVFSGGPTVLQSAFAFAGNGRQWCDFNGTAVTGTGANRIHFGIDVLPATPCTSAPPANSTSPASFTTCPGALNPNLNLASSYSLGGITYQWLSSTTSSVGPFTPIPGATLNTAPVPTLGVTTWFQAVATCTNTGGTTSLTPSQFLVPGTIVNSVPYYDSFETVQLNNLLPNCSWSASSQGTICQTYTTAAANNRIPRTGSKFGSFRFGTNANGDYFYTNGIQLQAGITYSASMWYITDGLVGWSNLSLMLGTSQTTTGLNAIASQTGAVTGQFYQPLSGTLTVPTSGIYYLAVKCIGSAATQFLTFDDLALEIPCSLNAPPVLVSAANSTICSGTSVQLSASGANTYSWNTGSSSSSISVSPSGNTLYSVTGTSSLTGCSSTANLNITVIPSPNAIVFAPSNTVCAGSSITLYAIGNFNFSWSTGTSGPSVVVSPTANTTYTLQVVASNGCTGLGTIAVTVKPKPQVFAQSNNSGAMCVGESVTLIGSGAGLVSYAWNSNNVSIITQLANVSPNVTTTYTLTGTDANGCSNTAVVTQLVDACTSLAQKSNGAEVKLFPNPTGGQFTIASGNVLVKTVEVSDVTGKLIYKGQSETENVVLSLENQPAGIYFVKITSEGNYRTIKVIKE